jgi:hypothetical protein
LAKSALGVNVKLVEVVAMLPETPGVTVIFEVVRVLVLISSLKTTVIVVLMPTPVAPRPGVLDVTVGVALSST